MRQDRVVGLEDDLAVVADVAEVRIGTDFRIEGLARQRGVAARCVSARPARRAGKVAARNVEEVDLPVPSVGVARQLRVRVKGEVVSVRRCNRMQQPRLIVLHDSPSLRKAERVAAAAPARASRVSAADTSPMN